MRTHDHNVWSHVEVLTLRSDRVVRFVRNPGARVHISDTDGGDMGIATCEAILYPLHESGVKTARFVVRITRKRGKAAPFVGALSQNTIFATFRCRPIEYRRILSNKLRTGSQGIYNLLGIGCGAIRLRPLSPDDRCAQKTK